MNHPLSFGSRTLLLLEAVAHASDVSFAEFGTGVTDAGILDLVSNWAIDKCEDGCTSEDCCDFAALDDQVWHWIETLPAETTEGGQ